MVTTKSRPGVATDLAWRTSLTLTEIVEECLNQHVNATITINDGGLVRTMNLEDALTSQLLAQAHSADLSEHRWILRWRGSASTGTLALTLDPGESIPLEQIRDLVVATRGYRGPGSEETASG